MGKMVFGWDKGKTNIFFSFYSFLAGSKNVKTKFVPILG